MKITELVKLLERVYREHGDIQVTCTSAFPDSPKDDPLSDVKESTVERHCILDPDEDVQFGLVTRPGLGKRVRLYW